MFKLKNWTMKYIYIVFLITTFFLMSCSTSYKTNKHLLYDIPNDKAKGMIVNEINLLKRIKQNAFLVFGKNKDGYKIEIIPTSDLKDNIQNFKIKNSNRMILLGNNYYILTFDYDYEFGATFEKEIENGEFIQIKRKKMYLYDYATSLYFDDKWSFIKKESLIKHN